MKITRCSTSAINTYYYCPFKYFLSYIMRIQDLPGKNAIIGTIIHLTLECMSKLKRKNKYIDPNWLLDQAWQQCLRKNSHTDLRQYTTRGESADFKRSRDIINFVVNDEHYNPYNMNIIDGERWFDIEMPGDEWQIEDGKQFSVRGFLDLVHEIDEETIEIVDWKTGNKMDIYTGKHIDTWTLTNQVQPRLYHIAAMNLYPKYKNIWITFHYLKEKSPVTIVFDEIDASYTIAAVWKFFETVKKDTIIKRNRSWKCRMCSFNKNDLCNRVWGDLNTHGTDYVEVQYGK